MPVTSGQLFSRRTAAVLLASAVAVFVVGVIALAMGWIEVATACAGIFTVMWLAMRQRVKKVARKAEQDEPDLTATEPRSARRRHPR